MIKSIAKIFFFMFVTVHVAAQNEKTDSLMLELTRSKTDTSKVNIYAEIVSYYSTKNIDSAITVGNKALVLAKKINHIEGLYKLNHSIGLAYYLNGNSVLSRQYFEEALDLSVKLKEDAIYASNNTRSGIALSYYGESDLYNSFKEYKTILETFRVENIEEFSKKTKVLIAKCLVNIGLIYEDLSDYEKALKYYTEGIEIIDKYNIIEDKSVALVNIGVVYHKQGKNDLAIEYIKKAIAIFSNTNNPNSKIGLAFSFNSLSDIYNELNEYNKAISFSLKSLDISKKLNVKITLEDSYNSLSLSHYNLGNIGVSESYALKAFDISKQTNTKTSLFQSCNQLLMIYEKKGDYKKVINFSKLLLTYQEDLNKQVLDNSFLRARLEFEMEQLEFKKQLELLELSKQNEAAQLNLKVGQANKNKRWYLIVITISIAALSLLTFYLLKLKRAHREVEILSRIKSDFLAKMSHEFKTPLHAIVGFTDLISEKEKGNTKYIKKSANNLLALTNEILNFVTLEKKQESLIHSQEDLKTVILDTLSMVRLNAKSKKIDFTINIDEKIKDNVYIDKLRLDQVLLNLVNNAIKYTSKGFVKVTVSLQKESEKYYWVYFEVKDSGKGIRKKNFAKILTSFFQESEDENIKNRGVGLGLPIVSEILSLMGSKLVFTSEVKKGSTFTFKLKLKRGENAIVALKELDSNSLIVNNTADVNKVLIVDDNLVNLLVIKKLLNKGYNNLEIFEAKNGKEAIEFYEKHRPSLILMDIYMPVMDGFEATKIIRNKFKSKVPIIAVTASTTPEIELGFQTVGMSGLLEKPVAYDKLKNKLDYYLQD